MYPSQYATTTLNSGNTHVIPNCSNISYSECGKYVLYHNGSTFNMYRVDGDSAIHLGSEDGKMRLQDSIVLPKDKIQCHAMHKDFLALGTLNGKVSLSKLKNGSLVAVKEFVPKYVRPLRCMEWNEEGNLIAVGLDRARNDFGLIVWDTHEKGVNSIYTSTASVVGSEYSSVKQNSIPITPLPQEVISAPRCKFANSEGILSLSWIPDNRHSILAGTSKAMRIFDIRDPSLKSTNFSSSESANVYSIKFSQFNSRMFATFSIDHQIKLWDLRKLDDPQKFRPMKRITTSGSQHRKVMDFHWSPNQNNILSTLTTEGNRLKIWSLANIEKMEKPSSFRYVPYKALYPKLDTDSKETIQSFAFHPTDKTQMIISTNLYIRTLRIGEDPKFAFSVEGDIAYANGKHCESIGSIFEREGKENCKTDISFIMHLRAKKSIGMNFAQNLRITKELKDPTQNLWLWGYRMLHLNKTDGKHAESSYIYAGVRSILKYKDGSTLPFSGTTELPRLSPSEMIELSKKNFFFKEYNTPQRRVAIKICGWKDHEIGLVGKFEQTERDVAIAIFHLDFEAAANILTTLSTVENHYHMLAFVLVGLDNEKRKQLTIPSTFLNDPYLKSSFQFLSSSGNDFTEVLESNISLADRVAFACKYLPDEKLRKYISSLTEKGIEQGNLDALLLTGLSEKGFQLMQKYVDKTGDIQTASLLFSHVSPSKKDFAQVGNWLHLYRDLLDQWRMWELRATLDTILSKYTRSSIQKQNPGVVIKCTYCHASILNGVTPKTSNVKHFGVRSRFIKQSKNVNLKACPSCRKPLPRCAICHLPYGSSPSTYGEDVSDNSLRLNFCFTFCLSCKHGGHVGHIMEWFQEHQQCPVPNCDCTMCFASCT